jgi:MOSC domain-containing protein YiiM
MRVISINIAQVGDLFATRDSTRTRVVSAIHKQPVAGAVAVSRLGVAGDEQADLSVHGGLEKAVYAYPIEHYAFWNEQRAAALKTAQALPPGSMGENLTIEGVLETDVWIGDRLRIGDAMLEVTEPRAPCFKFNAKMGFSHAAKIMTQSGFTGFYLRVVETGTMQAGDPIMLLPGRRDTALASVNQWRRKGRQQDLF